MLNSKFKILYAEYKNTTVISGSKILYGFPFWLTKILSFLQQRSNWLSNVIHKIVHRLPKPTFIIQNMSGIFLVQAFDDSTTICSDYFEKDIRGWLATPDTKDIFLDIGANRGIYTVIAPTLFGYQEIHAFEPNLDVVEILNKNIELNSLQNKVQVHHLALGETAGLADFDCDPMHKGGGRIVNHRGSHKNQVRVLPLDELEPSIDSTRISFIKIDTEGFEFNVLSGMKKTLAAMPLGSTIMIESTDLNKVSEVLGQYGFKHQTTKQFDHLFIKYA